MKIFRMENAKMVQQIELSSFMDWVTDRNPGEVEFHQAVHEVAETVIPFINANPIYVEEKILERLSELPSS